MNKVPEDKPILTKKYAPKKFNHIYTQESDMLLNINSYHADRRKREVFEEIREQKIAEIIETLKQHDGNITKAARKLGISRQGLQYRMQKLRIK